MRGCLLFLLCGLSLWAWAPAARAFGDCSSDAYVRSFDARLAGAGCKLAIETEIVWAGGRQPLRVVVATEFEGDPALGHLVTPIRSLAERTGRAMTAMGGVEIAPTTIFLTELTGPPTPGSGEPALGTAQAHGDECRVVFYWSDDATGFDDIMFTLAHELFHCIAGNSFHSAYNHASAIWWIEGSADYFAHLAYPGTSQSDDWIADFDSGSPTRPLWEFTYASVPFFFWLGQNGGPPGVSSFVHGMTSSEGAAAELASLKRLVSPEQWKAFGEAYLDRAIRQPGGRRMASTPRPGRLLRIVGAMRHRVASQPFVLHRERWEFERRKIYGLVQDYIDPGLSVVFSGAPGSWTSPPDNVMACRQTVRFRVLATTTTSSGAANYEVKHRPGQDTEGACCLVGEWAPTPAALNGEATALLDVAPAAGAAYGVGYSCAPPGGGWILGFAADGTGRVEWQGFSNTCTAQSQGQAFVTSSVRNGVTRFAWTVLGEGAGNARYVEHDVSFGINATVGGITLMDRTAPYPGPRTEENGFAFQCSVDKLSIQGIFGLNFHESTYTRASPPP